MTTPNLQNRCGCTSNNFVLQFCICFFASNMEQHGDHSGSVFGFLLCSCSLVVFVSQNFKLFLSFITLKVFIAFWCAFLIIKKFAYKFFAGVALILLTCLVSFNYFHPCIILVGVFVIQEELQWLCLLNFFIGVTSFIGTPDI